VPPRWYGSCRLAVGSRPTRRVLRFSTPAAESVLHIALLVHDITNRIPSRSEERMFER
jgi:hypothetical protein